jgi:aspartyl/asparaginyl-tRNA synthetase
MLYELNPDFKPPKRPFKRMPYTEGIEWLREHNVKKPDGTFYEFGEVSPFCFLGNGKLKEKEKEKEKGSGKIERD